MLAAELVGPALLDHNAGMNQKGNKPVVHFAFLRFSNNKSEASKFIPAHNAWIQRGFEEGVFLLVGSLLPQLGGAVVAHNITRDELELRIREDPFVAHDVVTAELLEVSLSMADPRLEFLLSPMRRP